MLSFTKSVNFLLRFIKCNKINTTLLIRLKYEILM
jgi:hypothetical protein